ncbi:MAG: hypothetical protein KGL39_20655 [Patescibacteria group bacterium]|nr:hypothetical protein [Patescibacteria group bacterium]
MTPNINHCQRCKQQQPTKPTRVSRLVLQLCPKCRLEVGWTSAEMPRPREAGPRGKQPRTMTRIRKKKLWVPPV